MPRPTSECTVGSRCRHAVHLAAVDGVVGLASISKNYVVLPSLARSCDGAGGVDFILCLGIARVRMRGRKRVRLNVLYEASRPTQSEDREDDIIRLARMIS